MGRRRVGAIPPAARPMPQHLLHQLGNGAVGFPVGAEVPGRGQAGIGKEPLGKQQVGAQGFEHVLPGTGRRRRAHRNRLTGLEGPDRIGHDPLLGPVAPADHVARPGRGQGQLGRLVGAISAEAGPPTGDRQLGGRLAAAVGVMAAEGIELPVGVLPFPVVIDLVGGDQHGGAALLQGPEGFKHMAGAEHIGLPGLQRFEIAAAHQGLGGQVKHHLRLEGIQPLAQAIQIGQIGPFIAPQQGGNPQRLVETGPAPITRIQAIALHLRAPVQEPKGEPAALEAGMATEPNAAAPPELGRGGGKSSCG